MDWSMLGILPVLEGDRIGLRGVGTLKKGWDLEKKSPKETEVQETALGKAQGL